MRSANCKPVAEYCVSTASYDVTKDGVKVAVLTFPKSSYRLGETINGVVEINERKGRARVLQVRFSLFDPFGLLNEIVAHISSRRSSRPTNHYPRLFFQPPQTDTCAEPTPTTSPRTF